MKLGQIMTLEVESVAPQDPVQRAAELMRDLDIGFLPVIDKDMVVGVVTDRDITVRFAADALDYSGTSVSDVMSREVFYCYEDQDVEDAAVIMEDKQIRRMIVLSRDNKIVGVVSLADLARSDRKDAGPVLEQVSKPDHRSLSTTAAVKTTDGPRIETQSRSDVQRGPTGTDLVNGLIKDELTAVETYQSAAEKFRGLTAAELKRLEDDHEKAAALLQQKLAEKGIEPATSSGFWGGWARLKENAAKLLGDKAAIEALKASEEASIVDYERALEDDDTPPDIRALIRTELLPQARARIPVLDNFLSGDPGRPPTGASYNADQGYGSAGSGRGVA